MTGFYIRSAARNFGFVACILVANRLHAVETSTHEAHKQEYKRRVLLTQFVNEKHDVNTEYLSASLADAFAIPLTKTGNFIILNRDSVHRYTQAMGIFTRELYETTNAVRLGRAIGADVVVVGRYTTAGQNVVVDAKAVDVHADRVSVENTASIHTNARMFDAINGLANKMSAPMAEQMKPLKEPPPPAEVIMTEEEISTKVRKIEEKKTVIVVTPTPLVQAWSGGSVDISPLLFITAGKLRQAIPTGLGLLAGYEQGPDAILRQHSRNPMIPGARVETGFLFLKNGDASETLIPFNFGPVWIWSPFLAHAGYFFMAPTFGLTYIHASAPNFSRGALTSDLQWSVGYRFIHDNFLFMASLRYAWFFDADLTLHGLLFSAGIGYRLF